MFKRILKGTIKQAILADTKKVVIIYGSRQVGKTTLINEIVGEISNSTKLKIKKFLGDDLYTQNLFDRNELESLKRAIAPGDFLVIDEAQRIENIGLTLKLLIDNMPVKILVSGSASFDLANKINEPLTGRTKTYWLYPMAYQEIKDSYNQTSDELIFEQILRYGMYPEVHNLTTAKEKENYLYEYINNYLYKDILVYEQIRKPKKVMDLLSLLALQVGKEVSIAELSQNLAMSQKAVQSYLDVLEKMFVLINLRGFSRNLRKEISKVSKYYFVDVGLRNAIIRNFNPLKLRSDAGELFENWFIMERIKKAANANSYGNFYFWRTYDQQEIDLIEESNGNLSGFECKLSSGGKGNPPKDWVNGYSNSSFTLVNRDNYRDFV